MQTTYLYPVVSVKWCVTVIRALSDLKCINILIYPVLMSNSITLQPLLNKWPKQIIVEYMIWKDKLLVSSEI